MKFPGYTITSIFISITLGLIPILKAIAIQKMLDVFTSMPSINSDIVKNFLILVFTFILLFLISCALDTLLTYIQDMYFGTKLVNELQYDFTSIIKSTPLILQETPAFYDNRKRAQDNIKFVPLSFFVFLEMLRSSIEIIFVILLLGRYDFLLSIIAILSLLPTIISYMRRGKEFYKLHLRQSKNKKFLDYIWSLFSKKSTVKEVRVLCADEHLKNLWRKTNISNAKEAEIFNKKEIRSKCLSDVFKTIGYVAGILFALLILSQNNITASELGVSIFLFGGLQNAISNLFFGINKFSKLTVLADNFYDFFEKYKRDATEKSIEGKLLPENGSIIVKNISFKYPNSERYALENVSFDINDGENVVILGENGSGKTTLAKILLGLYMPSTGTITYGNLDFFKTNFQKHLVAVMQNFTKYSFTVRENIAISDYSQIENNNRIINVLNLICPDNKLFKDNLDKVIGEDFGDVNFSGGEWQKIAIARVLFKESAKIIILDEPTSALDPLSEHKILQQFLNKESKKTSIIISHRIGICKHADKIIILKKGKIFDIGTHDELMNKNPNYKKMYMEQQKWYYDNSQN